MALGLSPSRTNQSLTTLGKYQLIAALGQGGMAKVYLALVAGPAGVNKLMVVKVIKSEAIEGLEGGVELFWDEARLAARLIHPNIVHTYEVGEIDGHYLLAMEYLEGQVYRVLQARTAQASLPLHEELRILCEVARGLHYAHGLADHHGVSLGVVHRDISPQNVFVTYEGQVKLIDFGIAKTRDAAHETRVGLIKGKLNYIAPEQLRGDPVDRRSDIFALGVMLWEAIAGRRFAGGPSVPEVAKVHARIKGEEPNIRSVCPGVDERLARIIDRAIALDREQRWHDAASFAEAIEGYMESEGLRPSAKALSAHMQKLFANDREAMQKVIDSSIRALHGNSESLDLQDLPTVPLPDELGTGSASLGARARRAALDEAGRHSGLQPRRRHLRKAGLALSLGLGLLLGGNALFFSDSGPPERPEPAPAAAPTHETLTRAAPSAPDQGALPKAAASEAQAVQTVALRVVVTPLNAAVRIDGASVTTPLSASFPRSEALHRVDASAPGYRPFARLMPFDRDQSIEITLEAEPEVARRSAGAGRARTAVERHAETSQMEVHESPSPPTSAPVPVPDTISPGADIPSRRERVGHAPIDTSDPYRN